VAGGVDAGDRAGVAGASLVGVAGGAHADDTTVPVLAKGKTDTGRCWIYLRDDRPLVERARRRRCSTTRASYILKRWASFALFLEDGRGVFQPEERRRSEWRSLRVVPTFSVTKSLELCTLNALAGFRPGVAHRALHGPVAARAARAPYRAGL
jgi:hypothetical protein